MTAHRRPFKVSEHGDGLLILAGNRYIRLSAGEVSELADQIAGPIIDREVARLTGLEA